MTLTRSDVVSEVGTVRIIIIAVNATAGETPVQSLMVF